MFVTNLAACSFEQLTETNGSRRTSGQSRRQDSQQYTVLSDITVLSSHTMTSWPRLPRHTIQLHYCTSVTTVTTWPAVSNSRQPDTELDVDPIHPPAGYCCCSDVLVYLCILYPNIAAGDCVQHRLTSLALPRRSAVLSAFMVKIQTDMQFVHKKRLAHWTRGLMTRRHIDRGTYTQHAIRQHGHGKHLHTHCINTVSTPRSLSSSSSSI